MKVLLLGFTKISYMPYMHFYLEQLKMHKCEIHLLYWDRDGKKDSKVAEGITTYKFNRYQEDSVPLRKKILSFLKYRNYAKRILKKNNFDLVIILHTTTGIVLYDYIMKYYKNKYILDYRDYTYENIKIYKRMVSNLIKNSIVSFVSSDAFRFSLPKLEKIYTSHNILLDTLNYRNIRETSNRYQNPIRIRYWGLIRHESINLNIIKKLANDERFELHYHGREQEIGKNLKGFCKKNGINNVFFHGEYLPQDRYKFAAETDIIHNVFENDKTMKPAMSNKLYDGVIFYIPQICNVDSFMGEIVSKYEVGTSCNPLEENFADDIYNYYNSIIWQQFRHNCDSATNKFLNEYMVGIDIINNIIKETFKKER